MLHRCIGASGGGGGGRRSIGRVHLGDGDEVALGRQTGRHIFKRFALSSAIVGLGGVYSLLDTILSEENLRY